MEAFCFCGFGICARVIIMRVMILVLLLLPALLWGEAYRYVDPRTGEVVFTDKPPAKQKVEPIKLRSPTVSQPYPTAPTAGTNGAEPAEITGEPATSSFSVEITSPTENETLRANDGRIIVTVPMPAGTAGKGYQIRFLLNGHAVALSSSGSATLDNLDRGTHTLTAELINRSGKVLATSAPRTFHLHRVSVLNPSHPANTPAPAPPSSPKRPANASVGPKGLHR
jgi:hypothetical protein